MTDSFFLGENAQSFKTSPKFDAFDMVVLNIDENNYVSSPYVTLDEETWESDSSRARNGQFKFAYTDGVWKQTDGPVSFDETATVDLAAIGITAVFNVAAAAEKAGDTIIVSRIKDEESNSLSLSIELKRPGRTLEAECPLIKPSERQAIADALLTKFHGKQYQPYTATGAQVDPRLELGDAITAHGVYSGVFQQELFFDPMMPSDISAPAEEETDNEYEYETANERRYSRKFAEISAEFLIQADAIEARVTKTGGSNASFAWRLLHDSWSVYASDTEVFRIDSTGATVKGKITAESGYIGTSERGFEITADAIKHGMTAYGDTDHNGIYIGANDGISLGGGKFKVDTQGNLRATSGTFTGHVYAGSIQYGGNKGTLSGEGITNESIGGGKVSAGSLGTAKFQSGVNTSLGYADFSNSVFGGNSRADYMKATVMYAQSAFQIGNANGFQLGTDYIKKKTATVLLSDGTTTKTIHYLAYKDD